MSQTKFKTTEAATAAVHEAAAVGARNFDRAIGSVKEGVESATAGFEQVQGTAKESMDRAMRTAEDMMQFSQGNLEAMMRSSQILAAGMQDLSKQVAATAQSAFDQTFSSFKAFTSIRSLKDAIDLQTTMARSAMERTLSETGRFTEASMRLAEQSMAPLAARVSLAVEKFSKAA